MDVKEIRSAIMFGNLSNDDINSIVDAIKYARAQMTKQKTRSFMPGDTVKFTSTRSGVTYTGIVNKIKIKNILVRTPNGLFNVPANMLEAA